MKSPKKQPTLLEKLRKKKNLKILRKPEHISYNALKDYVVCPNLYKLTRIDRIRLFKGNIYSAYGNAAHNSIEDRLMYKEKIEKEKGKFDFSDVFKARFEEELEKLPLEEVNKLTQGDIDSYYHKGISTLPEVLPALDETFPGWKALSCEESLNEDIPDYELSDYKFKGYIDTVLKTPDGKIHIIDWKTCGWGWKREKKNEALTTYQLTLYKIFYARKHNVPLENIETHFALLKRDGKDGSRVEIFRVTSGPKKINNVLTMLYNVLYNVDHDNFMKNKMSCRTCDFYRTSHCPHTVGNSNNVGKTGKENQSSNNKRSSA